MPSSQVHHHSLGIERLLSPVKDGSQGQIAFGYGENAKGPLPEPDNQQCEDHSQCLPNPSNSIAPLLQLPDEVLLAIMAFMPYSSLYMLRQTCHAFRNMVDDHAFEDFRSEILPNQRRSSCITQDGFSELRLIKNVLKRRTLCHSCGQMADSGELDRRLAEYWENEFCQGCSTLHPRLFFSSDIRDRSCLGQLGVLQMCGTHKISGKVLMSWDDHPSRRPTRHQGSTAISGHGRWVPALYLNKYYDFTRAEGHCSSLLVTLRNFRHTSIFSLGKKLRNVLPNPNYGCKHLPSLIESVLPSETPNNCKCFPPDGISAPGLAHIFDMRSTAKRQAMLCRKHVFACEMCRLNYTLLRDGKDVLLEVDLLPFLISPISPGWLSRLSFLNGKNPILDESTEGILWCRNPSCGTSSGSRWLRMLDVCMRSPPRAFRRMEAEFQRRDGLTKAEIQLSLELQSYERHVSNQK